MRHAVLRMLILSASVWSASGAAAQTTAASDTQNDLARAAFKFLLGGGPEAHGVRAYCLSVTTAAGEIDPDSTMLAQLGPTRLPLVRGSQCASARTIDPATHDTVSLYARMPSALQGDSALVEASSWRGMHWGEVWHCHFRRTSAGWQLRRCELYSVS